MALGLCGLVKQLYRPVCSYFRARKNRLLAGFSAVAQTRQLSHTACSLSFAYFNARIFMTIKTRVRRGHLKWHFPVASARCQAEGRTNFIAPQAGSTAFRIRCSDSNAIIWSYELVLESKETIYIYIASISPDIAFAAKNCASGRKRPISPHLLKIFAT